MEINRLKAARAQHLAMAVAFNKKEKEKDTKKELPMRKEEAEQMDEAAMSDDAHELMIHGDNNSQLYKSSYVPVAKNLEKKWKNGTYDHEKAKKLWKYHADRASESYKKEHGHMFSPAVRREAAGHYADHHKAEMKAGNMHESLSEAMAMPLKGHTYHTKTKELPMRKEDVEQVDERNKQNAMRRKSMDASRGSRFKSQGNLVPDAEPEHKTAQDRNKAIGRALRKEDAVMKVIKSIREMKADISESGGTQEYSGSVNKKEYKLPVSGGKELDDYSDTGLHRLLRKHNPHLEHHEVSAIVNSGGQDQTKETVVHKGKSYTHDVVNHQEPRRLD
jgi:hypothetical protein